MEEVLKLFQFRSTSGRRKNKRNKKYFKVIVLVLLAEL